MAGRLDSQSLRMAWSEAPWDSRVCGYPVLQITHIEVLGSDARSELKLFEDERDQLGTGLVSCRLPHDRLKESILLEEHGFRFIEMLYQPEFDLSKLAVEKDDELLKISPAGEADLPALMEIARTAFHNERFKVDPRLDPAISDLRYQNWVASSLNHPSQELFVISNNQKIIAFFVTEMLGDGTCYWHLNAVAPYVQGQGYGRRAWLSMLQKAFMDGAHRVRTCITARNFRVLNLYARLGFYFSAPLMTFHWVRS